DVYATKKWDTDTRYTSPLGIKLGLNLPLFYRRLLLSLDGESTPKFSKALFKTENMNINFGLGYQIMDKLNLFGGLGANLNYFAGLSFTPPSWYKLDYKFAADAIGQNHWVSMEMKFGSESTKTLIAREERSKILTTTREKMIQHYIKAVESDTEGEYESAMKEINEVLKIDPEYKPGKTLKKLIQKHMKQRIKEVSEETTTTETAPTK
ncbi:MAG: hypothetical protein PHF84_10680, partial [bacterium]|nr:hypothetical protein [bacterium]